jgi:hypothetical protein
MRASSERSSALPSDALVFVRLSSPRLATNRLSGATAGLHHYHLLSPDS